MVDQLVALGATLAAIFGALPIIFPRLQWGATILHRWGLLFVDACKNRFVVWTRPVNFISAGYLAVIFGYLFILFFTTGASLPWWMWVFIPLIIIAMLVQAGLDLLVNSNGTGLQGSVVRTLVVSYVGILVSMWVIMWAGCDLKDQLIRVYTSPPYVASGTTLSPAELEQVRDFALVRAHRVAFIVMTTVAMQIELLYVAFDWTSAGLRFLARLEYIGLRIKNGVVAGLDVTRTYAQVEADIAARWAHGNMAATEMFIINTWNRIPKFAALFLLERALVAVWMDYRIGYMITCGVLAGAVGHLVVYGLFDKDGRKRDTTPAWWTFLPFAPAALWIGYWLALGPYRESLGQVPVFHEIGQILWRLTHLPPITAFLLLLALGLSFAGLAWGGKKIDETFGLTNRWARFGVLVFPSLLFLPIIGGQLFSLGATDIGTPAVGFTRHWSGYAAWDTGAPALLLTALFTVVMSVKAWQMGKDGDKKAWFVAVPMLCGIGFFTVVGISAGYVVDAPLGAATGVYVLGTNADSQCTQAWQTPNGPSQCCAGTAYQGPPRAMCVPFGQ